MKEKPHLDKEKLEELYYEEQMSAPEIAELSSVTDQSVYEAMDRFGLERDATRYGSKSRVRYATLYTTHKGHERWVSKHRENGNRVTKSVMVHQILAIASGMDPDKIFSGQVNIHHKNEIPWDNRPENIEMKDIWPHMKEHRGLAETNSTNGD